MKQKGFTLIELLVVIAIIGTLSSIVLASLNSARGKGANAAVKANLVNIRAQAEIYFDTTGNGSYGTWTSSANCLSTGAPLMAFVRSGLNAANSAGGGTTLCAVQPSTGLTTSYVIWTPLKVSETVGSNTYTHWCIDSGGNSKGMTAAQVSSMGASPVVCQ